MLGQVGGGDVGLVASDLQVFDLPDPLSEFVFSGDDRDFVTLLVGVLELFADRFGL